MTSATDNRTTKLTAEQVREAVEANSWAETGSIREFNDSSWQAIADALNATLGSDDGYEAKMDELLCRLTNGKWSKSRAYSIEFMVSCIDEEYEDAYEKERAELGSGTCKLEETESYPSEHGMVHVLECSNCGRECEHVNGDYEHCPHCLARNELF